MVPHEKHCHGFHYKPLRSVLLTRWQHRMHVEKLCVVCQQVREESDTALVSVVMVKLVRRGMNMLSYCLLTLPL